jgi:nucleotide-binding universal stress UspA family protein
MSRAASNTYLVPVDFSKGSKIALRHAVKLARENNGKLLLVHIVLPITYPAQAFLPDYHRSMERRARNDMERIARRMGLKPTEYQAIVGESADPAGAIANQAKRSRAAMIVMSSHGRTGIQRLLMGSVAERTLRYAECPVLIVKR